MTFGIILMPEIKFDIEFDGNKPLIVRWWKGSLIHKDNGPAVLYSSGTKTYWKNNKLHREDGPTIDDSDGSHKYFINGIRMTEEQFKCRT